MGVKQKLIEVCTELGFVEGETLFLQGTLGADVAYPDSFVTFWLSGSDDDAHYNNDVLSVTWSLDVFYYSNSAKNVNTVPQTIRAALKQAGFVPQGKGQDLLSDEPTHTGWQMNFLFKDYE